MVQVKDGKKGRFMTSRSIDNFSRQPIEFDGKMQIGPLQSMWYSHHWQHS
jgi:hypothetical protein